jgi:hypothetical protein
MCTIKNFKTIDASLKHREWFFEIGGHDQAMKVNASSTFRKHKFLSSCQQFALYLNGYSFLM